MTRARAVPASGPHVVAGTVGTAAPHGTGVLSAATVGRLPVYLRALHGLAETGRELVSSAELAANTGVSAAKLRKDLSHLGPCGTRGVGYGVEELVRRISIALGLGRSWPVALVGAGHLGTALAGYRGFAGRGFEVEAVFDVDPGRVGQRVGQCSVRHVDELTGWVRRRAVAIGVIATPAAAAQQVCDRLVGAGVTSVLNFAPVVLQVPVGVDVRRVDLAHELQILAFHAARRASQSVGASA